MIVVSDITPGTKLRIAGGLVVEVLENMGDGEWLRVRLLQVPEGASAAVGSEELCHASDVIELA
ncbi:MAG TPA: hypothetical protein VFN42_06320 [Acetobacteraceae bacterium]|nr:hypothetical protein [Acetobacteraceae bacterium]